MESIHTSQRTQSVFTRITIRLILNKEVIDVYYENYAKLINKLLGRTVEFFVVSTRG